MTSEQSRFYPKERTTVLRAYRNFPLMNTADAAKEFTEVPPTVPFDILVANTTEATVHVQKNMVRCTSSDSRVNVIDPK